jgi:hypothetical protein
MPTQLSVSKLRRKKDRYLTFDARNGKGFLNISVVIHNMVLSYMTVSDKIVICIHNPDILHK